MNDDTFENLAVLLSGEVGTSLITDAKRLSKRITKLMDVRPKDFS